jgi:hypothetical protein
VRRFALVLAACSPAKGAPAASHDPAPAPVPVFAAVPAVASLGDPAAVGQVTGVHIAATVADAAASDRPAYARADQKVTLYAVVDVDAHGRRVTYSDAPGLHALPLAQAPAFELAWQRVEPAVATMSNTDTSGGNFQFAPIEYRATAIDGSANHGSLVADVRPTLTPDHGGGVGTMRFQVVARQGERTIASPGIDARRSRGSGGLTDAVFRVSIRRDDTYLGYLTELYGQPYIWASAGITTPTHQSERLEGSDCADFIIYGARRMGRKLDYTWTGGLPLVTKLLAAGTRGDDGVYRDDHGHALSFTAPGDLLLFPRHVGALVEDRGVPGVIDDQDIMMHSLFDTPKQQPIADSGYADKPLELRRFK